MNIIELAEKLKPGMQIRRKSWRDGYIIRTTNADGRIMNCLDNDDLTATDWEIIEEKTAYQKFRESLDFPHSALSDKKTWNAAVGSCLEILNVHEATYSTSMNEKIEKIQKLIEK